MSEANSLLSEEKTSVAVAASSSIPHSQKINLTEWGSNTRWNAGAQRRVDLVFEPHGVNINCEWGMDDEAATVLV